MAITIDGNAESHDSGSFLRNLGVIPRVILALVAIFIIVLATVLMWISTYNKQVDPGLEATRDFVDTFFLGGYTTGEEACNTINLTNSYNACVEYYDNEFYPTYNEVNFDYTVEFGYGIYQVRPYVYITNATSTKGNFNYTEIYFQLVHVYDQNREYVYDSSNDWYQLKGDKQLYEVLFQTIEFI